MCKVLRYCKVCTLAVTFMVCAGIFPGQSANAQSLILGFGDTEAPPLKWKEEGRYVGIYFDIVSEIISRSDVNIDLEPLPYKRLLAHLQKGSLDGAIGMKKVPEREQFSIYLDVPIGWLSMRIFVKKGHEFSFEEISDLSGRVIGKLRGISVSKEFDQAMQEGKFTVEETTTEEQSIKKLLTGRIDALAAPDLTAQFRLSQLGISAEVFTILPHPLGPRQPFYILFSKAASTPEKEAMIEKIRQALMGMAQEKRLEQIFKKYGIVTTQ